jgi:hypothetical protein
VNPCANHPWTEASGACACCGRAFCADCLVEFTGQPHCGSCRDGRLAEMQSAAGGPTTPPTIVDQIVPAKNPPALVGYYLGVFSLVPCVGLALGPAAVILGVIGLRALAANRNLPGKGHAIAAIVLGGLTTAANWGVAVLAFAGLWLGRA